MTIQTVAVISISLCNSMGSALDRRGFSLYEGQDEGDVIQDQVLDFVRNSVLSVGDTIKIEEVL